MNQKADIDQGKEAQKSWVTWKNQDQQGSLIIPKVPQIHSLEFDWKSQVTKDFNSAKKLKK